MSDPTSKLDPRNPAFPVCPRCGGHLSEPQGMKRLLNRGLVCDRCGYGMLPEEFMHEAVRQQRTGPGGRWMERDGSADLQAAVQTLESRVTFLSARVGQIEQRIDAYGVPMATIEALVPYAAGPVGIEIPEVEERELVPEAPVERLDELRVAVESVAVPELVVEFPAMPEPQPVIAEREEAAPVLSAPEEVFGQRPRAPRRDLEEVVSGRGLAFVGGLAILLGAVFFLSLAFSRGWIGPNLRVIIGVVSATAMILGGARYFGRREALFGHVLTATGLGVMSLSMIAATRLYGLVPVEVGVAGMLAAASLAAVIAIRANLQVVAAYGIVSALIAPPLLGADANGVMIALIAAALIGTTAVSLYRTWTWLPSLAFVLSAPQLADWLVSEPALTGALAALGAFWLLHAIAAGGEAFRFKESRLRPTAASLLVANATFLIWGGFELLEGDVADWRGAFLLATAIAHGVLGAWFLRDRGDRNPFGMLAFGTGVAALTMAVPVQFGAPIVPVGWAAEAVALAWVSYRLRNPFGGAAAAILGGLAIIHLALFEYPISELTQSKDPVRAFVSANGLAAGFVILALVSAGYFVRIATVRQTLAAVGIALAAYVLPYEISGYRLAIGWSVLAMAGAVLFGLQALADGAGLERVPGTILLKISAGATWFLAAIHLIAIEYPIDQIRHGLDEGLPFMHTSGLALLILLSALAVAIWRTTRPTNRLTQVYAGFAVLLYVMPFEFSGTALVGVWSLLAIAATLSTMRVSWLGRALAEDAALDLRDQWRSRLSAIGMTLPMLAATALAITHVLTIEYPIRHIFGDYSQHPPFLNTDSLALLFVLAAICVAALPARRMNRIRGISIWGAMVLLAMPFELSGVALVGGAAIAAVLALVADRWQPLQVPGIISDVARIAPMRRRGLGVLAMVAWSLAALHWLILEMVDVWADDPSLSRHIGDAQTVGAAILVGAALIAAAIARDRAIQTAGRLAAITTAAILAPYELGAVATVVAWSALALVAMIMNERDTFSHRPYLVATTTLIGLGLLVALTEVAPPARLVVDDQRAVDHPMFWSGATAALGSLAIVFAYIRVRYPHMRRAHLFGTAAGALTVYLLSIGVVDHFQGQVGEVGLESLQKRAQVALSILWAVLGGVVFAAGIAWMRRPLRIFGLALLGLATGKVFIYDMASLDTSYRVLSLIGLGVLLLLSSYLYQRFVRPLERDDSDHHHGAEPPAAAGMVAGA